jgi:hypothetical protein
VIITLKKNRARTKLHHSYFLNSCLKYLVIMISKKPSFTGKQIKNYRHYSF